MLGRPELCFWRLFGLVAIIVCTANILVLLSGNFKVKEFPQEGYHRSAGVTNTANVTNTIVHQVLQATYEKRKAATQNDMDNIKVKNPLWLPVNNMHVYFQSTLAVGKRRPKKGYLVFGVPTVYRKKAYYLTDTVKWLVNNLPTANRKDVVIVVFVGDFDANYRSKVVKDMNTQFPSAVAEGLIQVISAPREYYPDLRKLPLLYGDKPQRVEWRSKQSLDYSYLYYYCAELAEYYIQLEDDVLTDAGYFGKIKSFIENRVNKNWSTLEFGARGFIGMTYRAKNLPSLAKFARFYFWTMPIDWIFRVYNDIFLYGNNKGDVIKPPIFKHIGEFSSLDGQRRKLEDISSGKDVIKHVYQPKEGNPPAVITTSIKENVNEHTIDMAYGKDGYFWGKNINEGHYVEMVLTNPIQLSRIVIWSGSPTYQSDSLLDTELLISTDAYQGKCNNLKGVGKFVNAPVVDINISEKKKITCVRLTLLKVRLDDHHRKRWLIIREIALLK